MYFSDLIKVLCSNVCSFKGINTMKLIHKNHKQVH